MLLPAELLILLLELRLLLELQLETTEHQILL